MIIGFIDVVEFHILFHCIEKVKRGKDKTDTSIQKAPS